MDLYVLDNNFKMLYNVDTFESLIWKEVYNGCGQFEFYTPLNDYMEEIFNAIKDIKKNDVDCYIWSRDYDSYMIIEDMRIDADYEKGYHLIMAGRGLESILSRRIIWTTTKLNSKLQYAIKRLITESIISPTDSKRKISNFKFKEVTGDKHIDGITIAVQYTGDNVYTVIQELCLDYGLGFEVKLDQNRDFIFKIVNGIDRSFEQEDRPYVIFSRKYENLMNSDYSEETSSYKNVALVAGEDIDLNVSRKHLTIGDASGLKRREMYVDARDIQSEKEDDTVMTDEEYNELLKNRGNSKLNEYPYKKEMNCQIEAKNTFMYNRDFFIGDIVQVINDFGLSSKARVSEFTIVQDESGYATYPTFDINI